MRKHGFKIWFLIFLGILGIGCFSIFHSIPIEMEKTKTQSKVEVAYEQVHNQSINWMSEIKKDFSKFISIASSFIDAFAGQTSTITAEEQSNEAIDISAIKEDTLDAVSESLTDITSVNDTSKVMLVAAQLVSVVDGDTLIVNIGETECKIRLIGIDTPESVNPDESMNTVWGTYASDYTKKLLENVSTIYLEYDVSPTDQYGRTLAYVWLSEDTSNTQNMLNTILLTDGYAINKVFKPNVKYASDFENVRNIAESNGTGLWADEGFHQLWEN